VYFENVGGAVLAAVLPLLNIGARMPVCGFVAHYNDAAGLTWPRPAAAIPGRHSAEARARAGLHHS
jgi:NADPH-dependent curcumin reductase CurA